MRLFCTSRSPRCRAFTLPELMLALTMSCIVALTAWCAVEMGVRALRDARVRVDVNRNVYHTLQAIQYDILRAQAVAIPDPDYPALQSIQIQVPTGTAVVRRAYRVQNGALIVDYKDESDAPQEVFDRIASFSITALDAPANTLIQIECTTSDRGQSTAMRTVCHKRN